MTRVALSALLVFAAISRADDLAEKIRAVTDGPEYAAARWGILVADGKSGKTVYELNPDKLCLPASVTKLYTCATALAELGPDFRFVTPVYRRGEVKDGVLQGDLILVASGDLTFGGRRGKGGTTLYTDTDHTYANSGLMNSRLTDSDPFYALDDLAQQVSTGIQEVRGEILIDERLFPRARSSGSGPDVVSPMLVNDNVVDVTITPGAKEGDAATVKIRPETAYVQMDADVRTGAEKSAISVTIEATGSGPFMVRGQVPAKGEPVVRICAVDDPILWARALFIEALRRKGVKVAASLHRPRRFDLPSAGDRLPRVAEYKSEPLAETIKVTLKVSHNLYASTLPVLVGLRHGSGTAEFGLRQQAKLLRGFGVDPDTVSFAGGAGGAQADSVTPRATVGLLRAMAKHAAATEYFDALPILGVDGTLAEAVEKDSPVRGKVRAKTGTLVWYDAQNERMLLRSKALAGELETAKGTKLYVAMFLNDMPLSRTGTAAQQGKVLGKLCEVIHNYGP
ncbi:MAG TPA: D-alanyl-D-alanine carboxypeptidase/D-alanyl-D-alanine-endopeptidase [Gemmataceae bacterium]|nr:D-alanyl-D-alanine carboxypeptidase/D-alanyl-D-alanine-endopeptidase [Gemmataceae bacterium]